MNLHFETEVSPFFLIPQKKINNAIEDINNVYLDKKTGKLNSDGAILIEAIYKYAKSNIPVDYWFREMHDFHGDKSLSAIYTKITSDIRAAYDSGVCYCLAGGHGRGKTMIASCILKRCIESGKFSALYVNLTDIINIMASSSQADQAIKSEARRHLLSVDFLIIDEFDSRFMGTDNATDLFGRTLEPILRSRIQNKLPCILCTNNTNPDELFNGALQQSFKSLMKKFTTVFVLGKDFRNV